MPTALKIQEWINQQLANEPPRAKSLVMTVFGDAIAPHGGSIWLGSLISLMSHFGISDRLVRTSVFRLAEEGWLEARRDGRRSSYQLAKSSYTRLQHAFKRVYAPQNPDWDQRWTMLLMSQEDSAASNKAGLKKELSWQGFRMINAGVFAHPQADMDVLKEILERSGQAVQLVVCHTQDHDEVQGLSLSSLIPTHWQLDEVNANYTHFIKTFSVLSSMLHEDETELSGQAAFAIRSLLIHSFRRAQLHDPHLPARLRPEGWMGEQAYLLCRQLYQACIAPAEQQLKIALEQDYKTEAGLALHERFGSGVF